MVHLFLFCLTRADSLRKRWKGAEIKTRQVQK